MKAKAIITLFCILFAAFNLKAQDQYLWPIEGKTAGEGIIYKPQSYIGQELNSSNLIIAAPLNTNILAPVDGTIVIFHYFMKSKLNFSTEYGKTPTNFQQDSLYFAELGTEDVQFLNICVGIETSDRATVYICGLRPSKLFKTGQKVQRGDVIGTTGYYYKKIDQPCISVSITKNRIPDDPMTPFDLNSTFQKPNTERKTDFSREEATEDYQVLVDALKEGFPGLYDYVSESEFNLHTRTIMDSFSETVDVFALESAVKSTLGLIRDSHTALMNPTNKPEYTATICFGLQGDSMFVTRTTHADISYLGKRIVSVDGIPCDSMKVLLRNHMNGSDGFVESFPNLYFLTSLDTRYCRNIQMFKTKGDVVLRFADGEKKLFKGVRIDQGSVCIPFKPSWRTWFLTNRMEHVSFRKVSDTTAYLGLGSFDLNQAELDKIRDHFAQMANDSVTCLIIDLRNNSGGTEEVMKKIYSHIAQAPFRQEICQRVNKRGNFDFFRYSTNHSVEYCQKCAIDQHCEGEILFPDFEPSSDGNGFVLDLSDKWCQPDSTVNYKGRVYLLVNEHSQSASSVFAGWVKKQWRGAIVGRETGSTYHQMKAHKFENLMLPNSKYIIHFPLVQTVMDTVVNVRFPYGRGVLPDFELKLTTEELKCKSDSMLNYTLQLIDKGKYIEIPSKIQGRNTSNPSIEQQPKKGKTEWYWIVAIALAFVIITVVIVKINVKNRGN